MTPADQATKKCLRCRQDKDIVSFGRHRFCKDCRLELHRARYAEDEEYRKKLLARKEVARHDLKHIPPGKLKQVRNERRTQRREQVAALWLAGKSQREIGSIVGVHHTQVMFDLRASSVAGQLPAEDLNAWDITEQQCTKCKQVLPIEQFDKVGGRKRKRQCKDCGRNSGSRSRDPRIRMFYSSLGNARKANCEHSITPADIPLPTTCAYLGIPIDYRRLCDREQQLGSARFNRERCPRTRPYQNSPSIDRIDPRHGYILGNIQVISHLANAMKQNATVEQLLAFARGVLRAHGEQA